MSLRELQPRVDAVRHFNRFYTRQIGLLQAGLLQSSLSLTEVRVLYELAHRSSPTAVEISKELGLDAGYLSRMLRQFEARSWITRESSAADRRQSFLRLAPKGKKLFEELDHRSSEEVAAMLGQLPTAKQRQLVGLMQTMEGLLGAKPEPAPYVLRPLQPGDLGWVVHRHGTLYAQEYQYDEHFEALVAQIVAEYVQNLDSRRECCWIAEKDGEFAGCVFLVRKSKTVAKLRLLLVEPAARGLGIGRRLVEECVRFARQAGYKKMLLWTQSELGAARHIYEAAGFRRVAKESHRSWGRDDLVAETWALKL